MKLKNIFLILFLCCTSLCFAQDKLFEKYADMDNVTSVFISKKMFDMIPNVESGGLSFFVLRQYPPAHSGLDIPRQGFCHQHRLGYRRHDGRAGPF